MSSSDSIKTEREEAWIGDAVLSLYARRWILRELGCMDAGAFADMTSNHFLSTVGRPTAVEARIGRAFNTGGLAEAERIITEELLPLYVRQRRNRTGQKA